MSIPSPVRWIYSKGGRLTPTTVGKIVAAAGTANDEVVVVGQLAAGDLTFAGIITFSGANVHSGAETFSGANTFSGINTFSGNNVFTGNNSHSGTETFSGAIVSSATTDSTSTTTGALKTAGGLGVAKNAQVGGQFVANKNIVQTLAPYTAGTDTTAGWTLTEVKTGLVAGCLKTTTAAAVTMTLDSVANIITSFGTAGVTLATGSVIKFIIDNSQGANTCTLAVDGGATIAVATPALTGGATLTVSTANKIGVFQLYLTSATTAILSRLV